jgi:hypothetical protein
MGRNLNPLERRGLVRIEVGNVDQRERVAYISMSELTHYVATHVPTLTRDSQHPGVEQRFEGEFFIAGQ